MTFDLPPRVLVPGVPSWLGGWEAVYFLAVLRGLARSINSASGSSSMAAPEKQAAGGGMEMPGWLDALGSFIDRTAGFWQKLGDLEEQCQPRRARRHPGRPADLRRGHRPLGQHHPARAPGRPARGGDPPLPRLPADLHAALLEPRLRPDVYRADTPPTERAHKDRILVTPDSPEAMEEVLWMRFFKDAHDTGRSQVLDAATSNPAFERFYTDHLKKILLVRQGRRYLSKGNYNLTRFGYLQKLFPDARFIVPVREPRWHVASLMKQHRLFCAEERRDPRILKHMQRVGHSSSASTGAPSTRATPRPRARSSACGPRARRCAAGRGSGPCSTASCSTGTSATRPSVRPSTSSATRICATGPRKTLGTVFAHAGLPLAEGELAPMTARLSQPTYYDPGFTPEEEAVIAEETRAVRERLGYA